MKKKLLTLLLSLLMVLSLVGCNNKKQEETISHTHTYEVDEDGVWECIEDNDILSDTDKPYVAVLEDNEPKDIISLDSITSKKTNLGNGVIYKEDNTIFYNGNNAQNIIIKTEKDNKNNKDRVVINAPNDTVYHYGTSSIISLDAVATESFHEYGKVDLITLTKARIVLENESSVKEIYLDINNPNYNYESAIIAIKEEVKLPNLSRDSIDLKEGEVKTLAVIQQLKEETNQDNIVETKTEEENFVKIENVINNDKDLIIQAFLSPNSDTKDNTKLETKQTSTVTLEEVKEGSSHPASKNTFVSKTEKIEGTVLPKEEKKQDLYEQYVKPIVTPAVTPVVTPSKKEKEKDDPTPTPVVTKYTVTFDMQGHGTQVPSQTIEKGNKATEPAHPSYGEIIDGRRFDAWFKNDAYTEQWFFNYVVTEDITLYAGWHKEIGDIINNASFPTVSSSEPPHDSWKNGESFVYLKDNVLYFHKSNEISDFVYTSSWLREGNNSWVGKTHDNAVITFNMSGDVLTSITVSNSTKGSGELNGTYVPSPIPTISTIADVLETVDGVFPTSTSQDSPTNAWVAGDNKTCFIYDDYLDFRCGERVTGISISNSVTKNGDAYVYADTTSTIMFTMDEGKLVSIAFSDNTYPQYKGIYTAPAAPASTYTVTFDMQGHGTQIDQQTNVASGSTISAPAAPKADGYTFKGWYKEDACTNEWDFATDTVTADTTLYAKWTAWSTVADILATVEGFPDSNAQKNIPMNAWVTTNGAKAFTLNSIALCIRTEGKPIKDTEDKDDIRVGALSSAVTKLGTDYTATALNGSLTFHMTDGILTSFTFKASNVYNYCDGTYSAPSPAPASTYTVTFDLNGITGTTPDAQTITSGDKVTKPSSPKADGYTFKGWYKEEACTNEWKFDTDTVTRNTTLYAKWVETKTIAQVLPESFPTTFDDGWAASNGQKCYLDNNCIYFKKDNNYEYFSVDEIVEKSSDDYVIENMLKIKFEGGILTTIIFENGYYPELSGAYIAQPAPKLTMFAPRPLNKLVNEDLLIKPEENELVTEVIESEIENNEEIKVDEEIQPAEKLEEEVDPIVEVSEENLPCESEQTQAEEVETKEDEPVIEEQTPEIPMVEIEKEESTSEENSLESEKKQEEEVTQPSELVEENKTSETEPIE